MPDSMPCTTPLGDYFGVAAYYDSASATAYERLRRELEAHGGPQRLIDACQRVQQSETRHARVLGQLAVTHGGWPIMPRIHPLPVRPLIDMALANIVEGFVRQTYGAAVARFRAEHVSDPDTWGVMRDIADDEVVHAELAFEISIWLQRRLDPVEGIWVENALRHAVTALAHELDVEPSEELRTRAGVPNRQEALAIWSSLSHRTWHGISERIWSVEVPKAAPPAPASRSKTRAPFDSIAA